MDTDTSLAQIRPLTRPRQLALPFDLPVVYQHGPMTVTRAPDGRALLYVHANHGPAWLEMDGETCRWLAEVLG